MLFFQSEIISFHFSAGPQKHHFVIFWLKHLGVLKREIRETAFQASENKMFRVVSDIMSFNHILILTARQHPLC